ncbi:amidohydrolase family protein [Pikeienuella piscinae]|uniref:Amidohydrolase family protein n=1 Tax=Pikeienuella piscinae TaxID=2748098 RepID=A0A7L5BZR8_9RHOB|nr:amidohydrolase family protein [Pikeienuella piscinae]QIE55756.1 amidohydrolase family protein [Pikeienuella piscinae]
MENVAMPHLEVRPDWLAKNVEAPIEPGRPIIDPHHHLWERPKARYLFHDLLADVSAGHDIRATVYIQCRSMHRADGPPELAPVGEVEFAAGAAAMAESGHYGDCRICAGIVGTADMTLGADVGRVLDALEAGANGRLRGIRFPMAKSGDPAIVGSVVDPPEGLMREESVAAAAREIGRRGLVLDTWSFQTQLQDLLVLARRAPETVVVIDHVGGVLGVGGFTGKREDAFAGWRADMAALAALPNTRVKLGGLAMHTCGFGFETAASPPGSEELAASWRPYIETCIELFGPERAMFESNFPVDKGQVSYTNLWNTFSRLSSGASEAEKDRLFRETAAETYRLSV